MDDPRFQSGPLAFMAKHPVAANLLMIIFLVGGLFMTQEIRQEVFPDYELDEIRINLSYSGSTPEDVEQAMIRPVEDAIQNIAGVANMWSISREGGGRVTVEVVAGANEEMVMSEIQTAVDGISVFPDGVDRPEISLRSARTVVLTLVVHGDADEHALREIAAQHREGLLNHPDLTRIALLGMRPPEIAVEVPEATLQAYDLTLQEVADAIETSSVDLPGGGLRTSGGEILIRTDERKETLQEFEDITVRADADGTTVRLADIAELRDDFRELNRITLYDGRQAARLTISRVGDQSPLALSQAVHDYVENHQDTLPPGVKFAIWEDDSEEFAERIDLLLQNAYIGLFLVLLVLGLFLNIKLAFWVTLGIPISILGSLIFMPLLGVSFNMISLFAFILTLGIVVDYAIVVGEAIYTQRQEGLDPLEASIAGVREVAGPLAISLLTTSIVFLPLLAIPGSTGNLFAVLPVVVILVLLISLIEAFFILPRHLARSSPAEWTGFLASIMALQKRFGDGMDTFITERYKPALHRALQLRYLVLAIGLATLCILTSLALSGRIAFHFFPPAEGDVSAVFLRMPFGTDADLTHEAADRILEAGQQTIDEFSDGDAAIHRGILTEHGRGFPGSGPTGSAPGARSHLSRISVDLLPYDDRDFSTAEFTERWRENVGELPGIEAMVFDYSSGISTGSPISIDLHHSDPDILQSAAEELAAVLAGLEGVTDIDSGTSHGKEQLDIQLRREARHLGLTEESMGQQLRAAFFGIEALRFQRDRDELRVYVRRPLEERQSEHSLEQMQLRTDGGASIPLRQAADIVRSRGPVSIERRDGRRIANISASIEQGTTTGNAVMDTLEAHHLPQLTAAYPGLAWSLAGEQREQADASTQILTALLLALFAIYILLAFAFRSYIQPLIIMGIIPFGAIGAIAGHILMGLPLSFVSVMGIIALSGLLVNLSLILISTINAFVERGQSYREAIISGSARRFRPIVLTAATTFLGLSPMILETSAQAAFLIPMAISLGFGIVVGAVICLILVPCVALIFDDGRRFFTRLTDEPVSTE